MNGHIPIVSVDTGSGYGLLGNICQN